MLNNDRYIWSGYEPVQPLMRAAIRPYDELVELDLEHRRVRAIKHTEDKYFIPTDDGSAGEMFRYSAEFMIHPEDREAYERFNDPETLLERLMKSKTPGMLSGRFRFKLLEGGWHETEQTFVGGEAGGLAPGLVYSFLCDAEETADGEEKKEGAAALRDPLTGLLLENVFFARGKDMLGEQSEGWCLIAIDLEHFKLFNDWYGRECGDLLLRQFGARMMFAEEVADGLAGYFGQDDFCLLARYDEKEIEKLFESLRELVVRQGTSVGFLPAFGVAMADSGEPIEELYDHAALAAARAKDSCHSRIRMFEASMYEKTDRDYRVLSDFQNALKEHELFIVLQPQCVISTERVVGAESLVRWRKADGTMVSPGVFIPVLEEYGFVTDLDKYVWEEVCRWQRKWIDGGNTPLPISVNVSQIDIFTIDVPEYFDRLVKKYALPASTIKVEITESAYVDNDSVTNAVQRLREKGFMVLMDDFGSGYSSLNMLRSLNVDVIKLDAQFLRMNGGDRKGVQIVESIVNMAKTMSVPIIVEGVETKQETDFLSRLGCRYVQGYYFYKPMPVEDFERLIADPAKTDTRGFRFKVSDQFHTREFLDQNVFSDAVLNNVLGPIAFFSWHGDDVDVLRFNQQFVDEIGEMKLRDSIQRKVLAEDVPVLYGLFERALNDPLGGASGVLRFQHSDGTISQYRVQFFFLEEDESGKRFYGSVHDVTELLKLNDQMRLLTRLSPDSIIFLRKPGTELTFQVATHGLEKVLELDRASLERELYDGSFRERLDPEERERLLHLIVDSGMRMENFSFPFRVRTDSGREVYLSMRFDNAHDKESGVEYLMLLRECEKE